MFLVKVLKTKNKQSNNILQTLYLIKLLVLKLYKYKRYNNIISAILLLKYFILKEKNCINIQFWNSIFINLKSNTLIKYVLKMNLSKSNIQVNLIHCNGKIISNYSSGLLGFKSAQKIKKTALNSLIRKIKFDVREFNNDAFSIHFLGNTSNRKLITKKFKKILKIKLLKTYNLTPFNGCRPVKKKRKKYKKKLFLI